MKTIKIKLFILFLYFISFSKLFSQNYANFDWAIRAGGTQEDYLSSMVVDDLGNTYSTGYFKGSVSFGDFNLTSIGKENFFITKASPEGSFLWAKSFTVDDVGQDYRNQISLDNSGNIFLSGNFRSGNVTFGDITISSNNYSTDIFITKLDSNGTVQWVKKSTSADGYSWSTVSTITTDTLGNSYIYGFLNTSNFVFNLGNFSFESVPFSDGKDGFIAKLDANGNVIWVNIMRNANSYSPFSGSLVVDNDGNSYITGKYGKNASFGNIALNDINNRDSSDVFIAKVNTFGQFVWARKAFVNDYLFEYANDLKLDSSGNIYIVGEFSSTATFGSKNLISEGASDVFVAKYNNLGQNLWAIKAGGTGFDKALDIEIDAFENIYVSGISSLSPLTFGGLMVQFNGDISFISKISAEGQFLEVAKINSNNIMSMKTTKSGNLFIAGLLGFSTFGTITLTQIGGGDIYIAKLNKQHPLNVSTYLKSKFVNIYPNPTSDSCTVKIENLKSVTILDISGRQLLQQKGKNIDLSGFASGIYVIQIVDTSGNVFSDKLIKN